jgi:hypothetical protein
MRTKINLRKMEGSCNIKKGDEKDLKEKLGERKNKPKIDEGSHNVKRGGERGLKRKLCEKKKLNQGKWKGVVV